MAIASFARRILSLQALLRANSLAAQLEQGLVLDHLHGGHYDILPLLQNKQLFC